MNLKTFLNGTALFIGLGLVAFQFGASARGSYHTDRIPAFLHPFVIFIFDANREKMNPDFINQVVDLINFERTQADLDPLQIDSQLSQAAQVHTESMANDDFFSHSGVDGSSPFDRIRDTGYQYSTAAENIAAGYQTPEEVVQAWMGSAGHRANILNSDLTEIGVGYEYLANDTGSVNYNSYWTTTFGTPI